MLNNEQVHHEHQRDELEKNYQAERKIYEQISAQGFYGYIKSLENLKGAFEIRKKCVCCMDEGTPEGYHAAGSGILLNEKQLEEYYSQIKVEEITSHDGCGAAKLYAKARGLDLEKADEYAKNWAIEQARKRGLKHRHISSGEMKRSPQGHHAQTCYYDLAGSFNWGAAEGIPAGFVVSRKLMDPEYALKEVEVASGIAFGDHGLGKNILSAENPFYLVVIAENDEQLLAAKNELAGFEKIYGAQIKIDGFLKPAL